MERDFLGLGCRNPVVKQEVHEDCSEVPRNCGMLSSKFVRSVPQFLCFDGAQEDKQMKLVYDPLVTSRLLAASTDSSSSNLKSFDTVLQPKRHLNHMVCSSTPQCQGNRTANAILPVLPTSSLNLWKPASPSAKPSQLTIFYGGSVSVYDDVSPEKAQAIMLLAGNGGSASTSSIACLKPLSDTLTLKPSDTVVLPGQGVPLCNEVGALRAPGPRLVGTNGLPCSRLGSAIPPRISSPLASSVPTVLSSVALPQARKASLARFLEKRKERAISTMPYTLTKESLDSTVTTKDGGMDLMANSFDN